MLFTLALLAVYRIGAHIPTPGINWRVLETSSSRAQARSWASSTLFSGGNLRRLTIFALGIMPYITASIILQLMTVVFPYLEKLQKEGELGRRKITQYTRYLTIVLSIIQSTTIATALQAHQLRRPIAGLPSWPRLHPDDDPHPDHRFGVHHVAGRADQRTRHRQRHVADHFRRHRRRPAARRFWTCTKRPRPKRGARSLRWPLSFSSR